LFAGDALEVSMLVVKNATEARAVALGGAVAIGNFDGLHRGHQALLSRARAVATDGRAGALTFRPHPVKLLAPHLAPSLLMPYDEKIQAMRELGLDFVVELPFTSAFAALSPSAFVTDVLIDGLGVQHVVVGEDFSFGKGGAGKVDFLREELRKRDVTLHVVEAVKEAGLVCSSTRVRQFVIEGRVDGAALLLGHPFQLSGTVVPGDGRGRTIGFPTANVDTDFETLPKVGVYATWAFVDGERLASVTNIGLRPTFAGEGVRIETHLLIEQRDLYEKTVRIAFVARLRDEQRFSSADELKDQIARDVSAAREALARAM
jgi:riboflavin kinase/FMN adenylyltransferase